MVKKKKKKKKIRLGHPPHLCHMERTGRLHGHIHPKDDSTKLWTQVWGEEWGGGGGVIHAHFRCCYKGTTTNQLMKQTQLRPSCLEL